MKNNDPKKGRMNRFLSLFLLVSIVIFSTSCELHVETVDDERPELKKVADVEKSDAEIDNPEDIDTNEDGVESEDKSFASTLDDKKWIEDLEQLKHDISWYNASPFERYGEEAFNTLYDEIYNEIPILSDSQREYRFRELIYSIGDGHIDMWTERESDYSLPIMIDELQDGYFVVNAVKDYEDMIGEKISTINGEKIEYIIERLEKISNSENSYWQRAGAIDKLHKLYFYDLLGISNSDNHILTVNGNEIEFIDIVTAYYGEWVKPLEIASISNSSLRDSLIYENPYYYEFLDNDKLLYIRFSSCYYEDEAYPLIDFGKDILKEAVQKKPRVLLIDLRDNGGGRPSQLYAALAEEFFKETGFLNNPNFFVAINEHTFSAGVLTAHVLKNKFGGTLIGRPTGGSPYTTGVTDTANKILENTGISFRVSAAKVRKKMIENPSELPDIEIKKTSLDLMNDIDPVLDYVKAFE